MAVDETSPSPDSLPHLTERDLAWFYGAPSFKVMVTDPLPYRAQWTLMAVGGGASFNTLMRKPRHKLIRIHTANGRE